MELPSTQKRPRTDRTRKDSLEDRWQKAQTRLEAVPLRLRGERALVFGSLLAVYIFLMVLYGRRAE